MLQPISSGLCGLTIRTDRTIFPTPNPENDRRSRLHFAVHVYDEADGSEYDGELVFNEIGTYEVETRVDYPSVVWFDVMADGTWSLEIE